MLLKRSNRVSWNPIEPFNFVVANEDCNLYSFDMRRLESAAVVHKDFTNVRVRIRTAAACSMSDCPALLCCESRVPFPPFGCVRLTGCRARSGAPGIEQAVMDVDFSPTGREFVAGSYDRTVRFPSPSVLFSPVLPHFLRGRDAPCARWWRRRSGCARALSAP